MPPESESESESENESESEIESEVRGGARVEHAHLAQALKEYIAYRKKIRKPLTDRGYELLTNKLEKLSQDPEEQALILEQSMVNGWTGIFELKDQKPKNKAEQREQETVDMLQDWMNSRKGAE